MLFMRSVQISVTDCMNFGMRNAARMKVYPGAYFKISQTASLLVFTYGHGSLFPIHSLCMSLQRDGDTGIDPRKAILPTDRRFRGRRDVQLA